MPIFSGEQSFKIVARWRVKNGITFAVEVGGKRIRLSFTGHSSSRIKRWGLSRRMVIQTLLHPEEVVKGHNDRFIAHRRFGDHLVRAVYEYEKGRPVLVTVYFPYAERSFS